MSLPCDVGGSLSAQATPSVHPSPGRQAWQETGGSWGSCRGLSRSLGPPARVRRSQGRAFAYVSFRPGPAHGLGATNQSGHGQTRADTSGRADTSRCSCRGLGGESWVIALIQLTKTPDITSTAAPGVGARAHVSNDGREQRHVLGDVMPRGWAQTCPDRSRRTSSDGRSHGEMPEAGGLRQRERAEDGGAAAALSRWDVVCVEAHTPTNQRSPASLT